MKSFFLCMALAAACVEAHASIVYQQPPRTDGVVYHSSWWDPDGSDWDQNVWDGFVLATTEDLLRVEWVGGFDPMYFGSGGPVIDFTVAVYASIPGGSEPYIVGPPLMEYQVGGDAGQTLVGTFGGTTLYDYGFDLPAPFHAEAGTKYWVQIEAWQHGVPDWSIAAASSGDGAYFRRISGIGDWYFQIVPGNAAFSLLTAPVGVGDDVEFALALDGARPNPSRGHDLRVSLTLQGNTPAHLELFDVSGRRIAAREVGSLGAGRHTVDVAPRGTLAPGAYVLRLTCGADARTARVAVIW